MSAGTVPRRLVLVGSVVVDVTMPVPRLPERGGDLLATALSISAGGGMYVLGAAVRGGLPAVYAGRHGTGPFGDLVRGALREAGVEAAFGPDRAGDTGPCVVLVEPDGERTMVTANGVEAELGPDLLGRLAVRPDDAVYVSGYDLAYAVTGPTVAGWVAGLPAATVLVCDPGPLVAEIATHVLDAVLARTDVLTLNAREARLLGSNADPDPEPDPDSDSDSDSVRLGLLSRLAPGGVLVLRAGSDGATMIEPGASPVTVPVTAVASADTTGAGDIHAGALMAARAGARSWPDSVAVANEAVAVALSLRQRTYSLGVRAGVDLTKALRLAADLDDEETIRKIELGK